MRSSPHHAVGLRQRQRGETVVVHGIPNVAGSPVLLGKDVIHAAAHHGGVRPRVRVVPVGQHGHEAEADDAGLLPVGAIIGAVRLLGVLEVTESLHVHQLHLGRHRGRRSHGGLGSGVLRRGRHAAGEKNGKEDGGLFHGGKGVIVHSRAGAARRACMFTSEGFCCRRPAPCGIRRACRPRTCRWIWERSAFP